MEFRSQNGGDDDHDDLGTTPPPPQPPPSLAHNLSTSLRGSAFSKPTLSSSPSLLSSRPPSQTSRNGSIFLTTTTPSNPSPPSPMAADHHSSARPLAKSPDPCPPSNSSPTSTKSTAITATKASPLSSNPNASDASYRYKECLRNHAASIGVHVVDGCGEFMPDLDDPFKCAACSCHRSFHRKEPTTTNSGSPYYHNHGGAARLPLPPPPPHPAGPHAKAFNLTGFPPSPTPAGMVAFGGGNTSGSGGTTTESSSEERINAGAPTPYGAPPKRFRTKFTAEQKEKMLAFAERIGWRIVKQNEAVVEQFCAEAGVRRQVLKVWMHNNKHIARRQHNSEHTPVHHHQ